VRRRDLIDAGVDEEIRLHLDCRAASLVTQGWTADAARVEAQRRFGSPDLARAALLDTAHHRERSMTFREWFAGVRQDLRYAARGLGRERGFTAFIVATLALGIGANAAMFGVVDRLLLRGPEHVVAPDRVVRFYVHSTAPGFGEVTFQSVGYVFFRGMRDATRSFEGVAAYAANGEAVLGRGADARKVEIGYATAGFFPMLGARPQVGRFFTAAEDDPAGPSHVAVLGYGLWRGAFGGDAGVVGRTIAIGDEDYTVVGVAPRGFTGVDLGRVDVWTSMSLHSLGTSSNWTTTWNSQWMRIVARLRPGVTLAQASQDATAALRRVYDGNDRDTWPVAKIIVAPLRYGPGAKETTETAVSRWLVGVALVVLLIACANVINLLLARAVRRRREVAVRLALGAGRRRLVRLLVIEGLLLAVGGGLAGLAVAWATGAFMRGVLLPQVEWITPPLDVRVLAVTAGIALTVGVLVGLVPAIRASRPDVAGDLKSGVREGGGRHARLRGILTVSQAALSVVLLVGAGLFVRSLWRVRALDLGMQPDRVLVTEARWPSLKRFTTDTDRSAEQKRRQAFERRELERLQQLAGVDAASLTVGLPFESSFGVTLRAPGWDSIPPMKGGGPYISAVTSGYFKTMGTRLLSGRTFRDDEGANSAPVAIVNETMARTLWPGRDPLGACLMIGDSTSACTSVVGVVADTRRFALEEAAAMQYYIPFGQQEKLGFGGTKLIVRPRGDAAALMPAIRRALASLDPQLLFVDVASLQDELDPQIRPWRLGANVFCLFGGLALLVAAVGLYSVMAYLVAQRTHEIGVRVALGARGADVIALVMRNGVGLAVTGVAIGVGASLVAAPFIGRLLFDTSPRDPLVLALVSATLVAVAVLATLVPAVRARRVDPMAALRTE
jgi:putative ABC transport system permease protein